MLREAANNGRTEIWFRPKQTLEKPTSCAPILCKRYALFQSIVVAVELDSQFHKGTMINWVIRTISPKEMRRK